MRSPLYMALPIAGLCLMAACELVGLGGADDDPLVGPTWRLVAFEDASGDRTAVDPEYERPRVDTSLPFYGLAFTETEDEERIGDAEPRGAHRMEVRGYPNEGLFTYELEDDDRLSIYFHGATKINQLPGSRETEFFTALDAATSYRIKGKRLRITHDDGKALIFEARRPR
jgi:hypothetical protein